MTTDDAVPPHLARRWTGAFSNTYVPGTSRWPSRRLTHPAAPRHVLVAAAQDVERNREAAAEHLAAPAATLQRLAAHREYGVPLGSGVRWRTAQNPNCGPATLAQLACEHNDDNNIAAALNPSCGPATLAVLAADRNWKVRNAAAQNPNCGPLTLNRLADDEDWWVRMPTAANPSCDADVLTRLAADDNHDVRAAPAAVSERRQHPLEVLVAADVALPVISRVAVSPSGFGVEIKRRSVRLVDMEFQPHETSIAGVCLACVDQCPADASAAMQRVAPHISDLSDKPAPPRRPELRHHRERMRGRSDNEESAASGLHLVDDDLFPLFAVGAWCALVAAVQVEAFGDSGSVSEASQANCHSGGERHAATR